MSQEPSTWSFAKNFEIASQGGSQGSNDTWNDLKGARLFLTGGTGFFGCWLLRILHWANQELALGIRVTVLSRNPEEFLRKRPEFSNLPFLDWITGDIRQFQFPTDLFTHLIHGATEASAKLNSENPLLMLDTISEGTRRALEFGRKCGVHKMLFTSSGAVYGRQPVSVTHVSEDYMGGPDPLASHSAYAEGKRFAEHVCSLYVRHYKVPCVIARCFAFAGPYLPWDAHFAVGNFVRDGLKRDSIEVQGDGTPYRSYLYGADLAYWLLTLLVKGQPGRAYNVGSEEALSIRQIAEAVAETLSSMRQRSIPVKILREAVAGVPPERYIPDTRRAQSELGLRQNFKLRDSVRETVLWHRQAQPDLP